MRFKPTTLAVSLAAAIAALGALPSTVYAQPDPAPAPQSDADRDDAAPDRPTTLDAMNVTARRRVESAQDVPVAISAFDADDLVELQASNIDLRRADVRHTASTELRHAIQEYGSKRIARRDDLCIVNAKRSLRRTNTEHVRLFQGYVVMHLREHCSASMLTVTVGAVRLEVGSSTVIEFPRRIMWIGEIRATLGSNRIRDQSNMSQRIQLRCNEAIVIVLLV